MEYIEKKMSAYNLHIIKTNKFKTISIRICFRNKIKKEEITLRNILTNFLVYSTDTYPTKRELIFKCEDLYAALVYARGNRIGNNSVINFNMSLLNEKYTEEGMLEKSIKFFSDIIFNPNFKKDDMYNEAYNFLYKQYKNSIINYKDNKASYSNMRMLEEMGKDNIFGYRDIGYLEDLENITKDKLITYYNEVLNNSLIDIYVLGDVDINISDIIDKYFNFKDRNILNSSVINTHSSNTNEKEIIEEDNSNQSKLSIGCLIDNMSKFERNYVLSLYNMILGASSESKFFQVIREKNSLAYYVNSSLNKLDDLMIIKAGISSDNYDKVVSLIKELMKEMEDGKFSDKDIKIAKENYISLINEIEDNSDAIIDAAFAKEIMDLDDLNKRKEEILKVEKEDIINLSKKVHIDTIFLLKGIGGK